MEFNWIHDKCNERYVCEMPEAALCVYYNLIVWEIAWVVCKDINGERILTGTTSISIDYAQGKAEGAYMGLKATGQI